MSDKPKKKMRHWERVDQNYDNRSTNHNEYTRQWVTEGLAANWGRVA